MNLHEYQAKQLFARYGLPAPVGYACTTPREAEEAASKIGAGPWVVKCQVHAGGRGKAGGVKVVNSKEDIRAFAENWLGKRLVTYQTDANGQPVNQILVEAATDIAKELYLGAVVDRSSRRVVFMLQEKSFCYGKRTPEFRLRKRGRGNTIKTIFQFIVHLHNFSAEF